MAPGIVERGGKDAPNPPPPPVAHSKPPSPPMADVLDTYAVFEIKPCDKLDHHYTREAERYAPPCMLWPGARDCFGCLNDGTRADLATTPIRVRGIPMIDKQGNDFMSWREVSDA